MCVDPKTFATPRAVCRSKGSTSAPGVSRRGSGALKDVGSGDDAMESLDMDEICRRGPWSKGFG